MSASDKAYIVMARKPTMQAPPRRLLHFRARYERQRRVNVIEEDGCCVPFNVYQEAFLFDVYGGFSRLARGPLRKKPVDL